MLSRSVETVELGPDTRGQTKDQAEHTKVYNHSRIGQIVARTRDVSHLAVLTLDVTAVTKRRDFAVEITAESSPIAPAGRAPLMFAQ
jgi:hypothetical protein